VALLEAVMPRGAIALGITSARVVEQLDVTRETVVAEIGELFQRLANGGAINAVELTAMREHIAQSLSDPNAPLTAYFCNARRDDGTRCGAILTETNAPYGRAKHRCRICGKFNTIYYGGYQRYADNRQSS
jgi:hypothetical protein